MSFMGEIVPSLATFYKMNHLRFASLYKAVDFGPDPVPFFTIRKNEANLLYERLFHGSGRDAKSGGSFGLR